MKARLIGAGSGLLLTAGLLFANVAAAEAYVARWHM